MAPSTLMTLAQIVKRVEKRSTVSSADVKAVLDALQNEVIEALENGNTVRLGDLGSFRLTMKSQGVETATEAKKKGALLIKKVNVQFTNSTAMRDALTPQPSRLLFARGHHQCFRQKFWWKRRFRRWWKRTPIKQTNSNSVRRNGFPRTVFSPFSRSKSSFSRVKNTLFQGKN